MKAVYPDTTYEVTKNDKMKLYSSDGEYVEPSGTNYSNTNVFLYAKDGFM